MGEEAAEDAAEGVKRIIGKIYGIALSDKEEVAALFCAVFTSIGATYDASDLRNIRCSPRDEKRAKHKVERERVGRLKGTLNSMAEVQAFVGLHEFMANGGVCCNSGYKCLHVRSQTMNPMGVISK